MPDLLARFLLAAPLAVLVVTLAHRRRALTRGGAVAAAAVGTITVAGGGWWWGVLLIAFFGSSSAVSMFRSDRPGVTPVRGHERDAVQVAANGGIATAIAALGLVTHDELDTARFALFCGTIAAVNADTWATEIGRLSRAAPRLITTGRPVTPGVSGGVTPLGILASALGAVLIGVLATLGAALGWTPGTPWTLLVGTTIAGLAGSLLDSLLGATAQVAYRERQTGRDTERRTDAGGAPAELARGIRWVTNDVVNLAASLTGAFVAGVIWRIAS